ncbi:MAG: hypothetical protein AAFP82_04130, partial [Bacteroidota bacterium]
DKNGDFELLLCTIDSKNGVVFRRDYQFFPYVRCLRGFHFFFSQFRNMPMSTAILFFCWLEVRFLF